MKATQDSYSGGTKKFFKDHWRVFVFVPTIIGGNLPSIIMEGFNPKMYAIGTGINIFMLNLWLWIVSGSKRETEFGQWVILTGVITSGKGIVDAVTHADMVSSVTEIIIYVFLLFLLYKLYITARKYPRSRKHGT